MGRSETGCQLYLIVPAYKTQDMIFQLAKSGCFDALACVLLQSGPDEKVSHGHAEILLRFTQAAGIPLLLENDIYAAAEIGADGVHIPGVESLYGAARSALGGEAIIGVDCGLSRHTGLRLGEMGADYTAFNASADAAPGGTESGLEDMIVWWSEFVTIPSVAWNISGADDARRLSDAGADFIAMGEAIWTHSAGPASAVAQFSASFAGQQDSG